MSFFVLCFFLSIVFYEFFLSLIVLQTSAGGAGVSVGAAEAVPAKTPTPARGGRN
jgi:hypothetical protein